MTVSELIRTLETYDPNAEVDIWASDGAMGGNYWDAAREVFLHKDRVVIGAG